MKRPLIALLLLLVTAQTFAIVSGQAKPSSWGPFKKVEPQIVKIVFFGPGIVLSSCTGIQLTRKIILTAAHCLNNERGRPSPTEITYYKNGEETSVSINKRIHGVETITHPDYEPLAPSKFRTDVGLIILKKGDLPKRGDVEILPGGDGSFDHPHNIKARRSLVFGTSHLKMDTLAALPVKGTHYSIEKNELTFKTYRDSSQVCKGDSGGPLLQYHRNTFKLYGVLSKASAPTDKCSNQFIITLITPEIGAWISSNL